MPFSNMETWSSYSPGSLGVHSVKGSSSVFMPMMHKPTQPRGAVPEENSWLAWCGDRRSFSQGWSSPRLREAPALKALSFPKSFSKISIMLLKSNVCWPDD